jgi:predicted enzyme related to lactoylglutathione lyase
VKETLMGAPFVWFDLTAAGDGDGTVGEFYRGLFGWTVGPGAGDYQRWFTEGGQPWAGVVAAGPVPAGRWVPYVVVDDLDAATKRAVALGGRVVRDRTAGPAGASVLVADPNDGLVALFVPAG